MCTAPAKSKGECEKHKDDRGQLNVSCMLINDDGLNRMIIGYYLLCLIHKLYTIKVEKGCI